MAIASSSQINGEEQRRQRKRKAAIATGWKRQALHAGIRCAILSCLILRGAADGCSSLSACGHLGGEQPTDPGEVQALRRTGHHGPDQPRPKGPEYKRKTHARIERLKKALVCKDEQWNQFRAALKEHLLAEQQRYEKEKMEIQEALQQAQVDLDKMVKQGDEEMEAPMEPAPDPLDELLKDQGTKSTSESTSATPEVLQQTQAEQMMLRQQVGELQQ